MCTQSVKQKEFLVQLVQKKVRISIGNIDLFAYYTLILFSKIQKFYRVKELSKSNQTRYGVYHAYLERKTKRIFVITRLQNRSFFNRKFRLIRLFYFQKYRTFIGSRNCPKRTKLGMEYPMCTQSVKKKYFMNSLSRKKFVFQSKISTYSLIIRLFCFQNYRIFIGSRSCPNRTKLAMEYLMRTQSVKRKELLVQLVYKKKSFFNRKFRLLRLFYFQNYRNFIGTRNCPKRTKLGMEYPICTQSVKQKEFLVQLVQKKVRISIGNIDLFAYYTLILFSKIQKFYRVKQLSKSNQTRYGVSRVYLERKPKRIFVIACLQKSSFFNRKFRLIRLFYFQKYRNFIGSRNCPKRTKLGMEYPMCTQSVKQKEFLVQLVQKKVRISIGNFGLFAFYKPILFSKLQKFYRVKELSKSNQTRYGVFHVYLERKTKRIFGIACLQKRSFFNRKFRLIRLFYFQKYRTFIGSMNCPKRTKLGMEYPMCTQSVKQKEFLCSLSRKKFVFQSEISAYSLFTSLFYFQNYRNFIGSRSCPNRTKLAREYSMRTQSVKRKEFLVQLVYRKDRFSIGNFDLFGYSIFKNIELLLGQGIVQNEPNSVWSIPCVPRA